jgi:ABC transport system ATP-binding/permease protein
MDDLKAWDFEARVREMLTRFNITDFDQIVATLSGGQRKRLALVRLILSEPEFIILDEPTNHLDLDMIEWLEELPLSTQLYALYGYARPLLPRARLQYHRRT